MTWTELEKIESFLRDNGYTKTPYKDRQGDYFWWKAFGKGDNPFDEERPLWWIELNVFDWREWASEKKDASMTVSVFVSRVIEEVPIWLEYDLKDDIVDLKDIEDKAYNFYRYIEDNFKLE